MNLCQFSVFSVFENFYLKKLLEINNQSKSKAVQYVEFYMPAQFPANFITFERVAVLFKLDFKCLSSMSEYSNKVSASGSSEPLVPITFYLKSEYFKKLFWNGLLSNFHDFFAINLQIMWNSFVYLHKLICSFVSSWR